MRLSQTVFSSPVPNPGVYKKSDLRKITMMLQNKKRKPWWIGNYEKSQEDEKQKGSH